MRSQSTPKKVSAVWLALSVLFLAGCQGAPLPEINLGGPNKPEVTATTPPAAAAPPGAPAPQAAAAAAPAANFEDKNRSMLADLNRRLSLMEREVAGLRGELEVARHENRKLKENQETLLEGAARTTSMAAARQPYDPTAAPSASPFASNPAAPQPMSPPPAFGQVAAPQGAPPMAPARMGRFDGPDTIPSFPPPSPSAPGPMAAAPVPVPAAPAPAPVASGPRPFEPAPAIAAAMPVPAQQPMAAPPAAPMAVSPTQSLPEPVRPANAKKGYDDAFLQLKSGRYEEALQGFSRFLKWFPDDGLSDNAQYWVGEVHYVKRRFPEALAAFNQVLLKWPASDKAPGSLLKIGFAFYELNDLENAQATLGRLISEHPTSPAVGMAKKRLAKIKSMGGR